MRQASASVRLTAGLLPRGAGAARRAALLLPRRLRRGAAIAAIALAALCLAYLGWFRDSSLVAVEEVRITGLTTPDAPRIEAALASAGRDMTTLNLDVEELEEAVAIYPVVRAVEARADFPHGLRIHVREHLPVAVLEISGRRTPVAADGTVLTGMPPTARLPRIDVATALSGSRVAEGPARALVRLAGAAPAGLAERVEKVRLTRRGVVASLRDGPQVIFGSAARARAKWLAAASVLADPSASGAAYVDVRIPERPTAGGLPVETIEPPPPAGAEAQPQPQPGEGQPAPQAPPAGTAQSPPQAVNPQPQVEPSPDGNSQP